MPDFLSWGLERSYYIERYNVSRVESNMIEKRWFKDISTYRDVLT